MSNIYQIITEDDLDELISMHQNKMILIFFTDSSRLPMETKRMRYFFKQFSHQENNGLFLFVDLSNYQDISKRYTADANIPRFALYYNSRQIFYHDSYNMVKTREEYTKFKQRIMAYREEIVEEDNDDYNTEYEYIEEDNVSEMSD